MEGAARHDQGHDRQQSAFEPAERLEQVRQRTVEATREGMRTGAEALARGGRRLGDELTRTLGYAGDQGERLARESAANFEAVARGGTTVGLAMSDISRQWVACMGEIFNRNMDGLERLARCRTVQEVVHVQSQLAREHLERGFDDGRRIAEIATRAVGEAAKTLSETRIAA